ncbi:unnamed protein product [Cochlearia groenlandica]
MPLVRFTIRNELTLGGPELNRDAAVEYEEPKAILAAVEVAGLVGILRQLGDLAEFSAEVFNGIQEEVTLTASKCHKLTSRVRRIESALSPLEKAVLSQTSHIHFAYTAGSEWHPRMKNKQRHFVQSDLPLCVMETYEQCRDPPPLHLLDRFDLGGPGSCLRKYSDPTFFRKELSNQSKTDDVKVQRDQAHRKRKKKKIPQRNICRSRAVSTSDETNGDRLSSPTDDIHSTSRSTSTIDMARSSNMQDLSDIIDHTHLQGQSDLQEQSEEQIQSDFQESSKARDSITGSGYIEYVINQSSVNKPDVEPFQGFLSSSVQTTDRICSATPEGCVEAVSENILYSTSEDMLVHCASIVCDEKKDTLESVVVKSSRDEEASEIHESKIGPGTPDREIQNQRDVDRTYIFFDEVGIEVGIEVEKQSKSRCNSIDGKPGVVSEGESKSEQEGSEADEFMDACNTIESESESEVDGVLKPKLEHYFGDIRTYCSEDANSDTNNGSEDTPFEQRAEDPRHDNSLDESCSSSYLPEDANVFCSLSDQVCGKPMSHDENLQKPREIFPMHPLLSDEQSLPDEQSFPYEKNLQEETGTAHTLLAGDDANEKNSFEDIPYEQMAEHPHHDNSLDESCSNSYLPEDANVFCSLSDPVCGETVSHDENFYKPREFFPMRSSLLAEEAFPDETVLQEVSGAAHPLSAGDAIPAEKILPEEQLGNCPSFAEIVPTEKILTDESLPKVLVEDVPDNMNQEEEPDGAHPSFLKADQEKKMLPEVLDSKNLPVPEAGSQEKTSHEESVGVLAEAVPDERFLTDETEEPASTCMSPDKVMPIENLLPEKPLEADHCLPELPQENILQEKSADSTHQSCGKATLEENLSAEVLDSTNLSVAEDVSEEQNRLEEFVGSNTFLENDERVLPEEPVITCLSLKKSMTFEKGLPEELSDTYPSLVELAEETISHEDIDDATNPSKAVIDEESLPQEKISLPQEKISLEEFACLDPCLVEAVPEESFLSEEPVISCLSLKQSATIEGVLPENPENPLDTYSSFAECHEENILHEEAHDATVTHPSISEAVSDEKISPEVFDSTNSPVAAALPQEEIILQEFISIDPWSAEAVPDKRILQEEAYGSLEQTPKENNLQEYSVDGTDPSCAKVESDGNVSSEVLDSEDLHVAEASSQEKTVLEEFVDQDPFFSEVVPNEMDVREEPISKCMSLTKEEPIKKLLPAERLEVYPSLEESPGENISQEECDDDKISPLECFGFKYPSLEASVPQEETSHEELAGTNPFLEVDVPNVISFPDEHDGVTYQNLAESVTEENNSQEEPLPRSLPFVEAGPDENIDLDESDALCPPPAETVFSENVSGSEASSHITEAGSHNTEASVPKDLFLAETGLDVKILISEAPGSTTEIGQDNKIFPEEPVPADLFLAEVGFDVKIVSSEAPGSTTEIGPHNQTFTEEPIATNMSLTEHVPNENVLPKEPSAAYLDLAGGIPDEKVFLDDAAFLSFAEAIFDQKFSPEVPDSAHSSLREGEAYNEHDSSSDVSMKSGGTVEIVEPVSIWSNGGLLGLAPSKPPVFAEPKSVVSEQIQNGINEASVLPIRKQEPSLRSVEDTAKSSLSLVVSDPTSQQQSSSMSHSNGSHSQPESTATSFKVFGLSHRLLMAGFRGNPSSVCKFESIPTTSYNTEVAAIEDKTRQTPCGSSFEEQSDYESSLFSSSPTSSPPVEHMRISFNAKDASSVSKLKLRIPCQTQHSGEYTDMFTTFQLVPEEDTNSDDDDNNDIFCQSSSPCVSDNCLSDSELWESDESRRNSISSLKQGGERSTQWEMGSSSGSLLDLPCFDSLDHQSTSSRPELELEQEEEEEDEYKPSVSEIIRDWPPNQPKNQS